MALEQDTDRAPVLRAILDELMKHREEKRKTPSTGMIDNSTLFGKPGWWVRMQSATRDGIAASLSASIREEGWRAYAEGGLDAMEALLSRACAETNPNEYRGTIIFSRWDGIGTEKGGYWNA